MDEQPYEKEGWYHRYVKIMWWKPDMDDWEKLPDREQILGCPLDPQQGISYELSSFQRFRERWGDRLDSFKKHVAEQLVDL